MILATETRIFTEELKLFSVKPSAHSVFLWLNKFPALFGHLRAFAVQNIRNQ